MDSKLKKSAELFKKFLREKTKEELEKIEAEIKLKNSNGPTAKEYFDELKRLGLYPD